MSSINRLASLQLVGPAALFAAISVAEAAAWALSAYPGSEWLWALNLTYFNAFQQAHYTLQSVTGLQYEQFFAVALPLLAAAAAGIAFRRPLLLGIASNLSLVYIAFVLLSWHNARREAPQASLVALYTPSAHPDAIVLIVIGGVALFSFAVTHIDFLRRARAEPR